MLSAPLPRPSTARGIAPFTSGSRPQEYCTSILSGAASAAGFCTVLLLYSTLHCLFFPVPPRSIPRPIPKHLSSASSRSRPSLALPSLCYRSLSWSQLPVVVTFLPLQKLRDMQPDGELAGSWCDKRADTDVTVLWRSPCLSSAASKVVIPNAVLFVESRI